jgi:hypothetical protein
VTDEARCLLGLLAASDDGCTADLLEAHGLPLEVIVKGASRAGDGATDVNFNANSLVLTLIAARSETGIYNS